MRLFFPILASGFAAAASLSCASAGDFTGVYAGVHAGYASSGGDKSQSIGIPGAGGYGAGAADATAKGLPPSALSASQALQPGSGASTGRTPPRR